MMGVVGVPWAGTHTRLGSGGGVGHWTYRFLVIEGAEFWVSTVRLCGMLMWVSRCVRACVLCSFEWVRLL